MARERGEGSIYRPKGSNIYHVKFYKNGRPIRETTGSPEISEAKKVLRQRLAEVRTDTFVPMKTKKIRVSELADDLVLEYKNQRRKSLRDLESRWKIHLAPVFGDLRAVNVTSSLVAKYVNTRQEEGAENATINRELAALKRLFSLGRQSTPPKVRDVPYIPMLAENDPRNGFLESKQHDALAAETGKIGLWLRAMFEVGYSFGWRKAEVLALRVRQVDLVAGTIRLERGSTKNGDGRVATMTPPVKVLLMELCRNKALDDAVFTRQDGSPVLDFRKSWETACEAAGVPGLLFHDLRRSAVRNLRRARVSEGVIMKISGHKTRSVFERYNIVDDSDLRDAMTSLGADQKLRNEAEAAQEKAKAEMQFGHSSGTVDRKMPENSASELRLPAVAVLPN